MKLSSLKSLWLLSATTPFGIKHKSYWFWPSATGASSSSSRLQPWLCATPWPWASTRATRWRRTWASRGTAAAAGASPSTPSSCGTWSGRCAASPRTSGGPWSCSRCPRTSAPSSSSRSGSGRTSAPRGRERSWATCWRPCGKQPPRRTDPLPTPVIIKPSRGRKKKRLLILSYNCMLT